MTQVPPSSSTRSWWRRIASRSSVMLKANITLRPVRWAWRSIAAHHRAGARVERAGRAVGLQLVVLDEVDAGLAEAGDELGRRLGVEPDARLDDGPDQRAARARR